MFKRHLGIFVALLVLPALVLPSGEATAQTLNVGYTDHEIIILNMPRYREIQEQLQQEYAQDQQELQAQATAFQEKVDSYQRQQALLSAESRQSREQELMAEQQQLQQNAAQREQALGAREAELMAPLYESVDQAIQAAARERGLDLVLRAQVGVQPLILFVNEERIVNITEDVARRLGIDVDATAATGSAPAPAPAASGN